MDWKEKKPQQYALYFKCTSRLVPTFKLLFGDRFNYEGDRAKMYFEILIELTSNSTSNRFEIEEARRFLALI